jgi:hypothetical protein
MACGAGARGSGHRYYRLTSHLERPRQLALFWVRPARTASSIARSSAIVLTRKLEGHMTPKLNENKEFSEWFRDWTGVIRRKRASVERALSENNISTDEQEFSDGPTYPAPKGRVPSDRQVT